MPLLDRATPNAEGRLVVTAWLANVEGMGVMHVEALQCPDDYWWVPACGLSIPAARLHETEAEARAALLIALRKQRDGLDQRLRELDQEVRADAR
jgi:hypothetical protein